EGRSRRRVGQVVSRNVNGLNGRNGTRLGGGNTLLQLTHFLSQRRLITHGGRHTTKQSGHFRTSQGVTVDVVHEEEDVTAFVTELLSHGQAGQRHTETVAGRFVHLTEHHGHLGLFELVELNNTGFCHFVIEVVPFTGTLTHTSENGQTAVRLGDVVDELKHVNRLAHAGAAEQADLTALRERADQVNNLNAGFEQFNGRRQLVECRCVLVNGTSFGGFDGTALVDGAAQDVHNAAQSGNTNGYRNRRAGVDN